jgi:diaminohydroxyphosphoribosylaminopyrimidine deaminase/5-amino-6-(5-phosphoribosylamino)uracil reductase
MSMAEMLSCFKLDINKCWTKSIYYSQNYQIRGLKNKNQIGCIFVVLNPHQNYMKRCLQLAGKAQVFPNPMVGAVVVYQDKIIGEGFHENYGGPHAEVNAVNKVTNPELLSEATLYVSLEPCCHFGKTPPCTNLIIQSGIKTVVVGCLDPNPLVAGKGVEILRNHGITVVVGILEDECKALNYLFFESVKAVKPMVHFILKWAESADGFMGKHIYQNPEERELSNPLVKRFVHKLRSNQSAILIGTNTAKIDNPLLDARFWSGNAPIAVLIDKELKISTQSSLFLKARKVLVLNALKTEITHNIHYQKISFTEDHSQFWNEVEKCLVDKGIYTVLIEGGSHTIQSFLNGGLKSEIYRIKTSKIWNDGVKAPEINKPMHDKFSLGNNEVEFSSDYAF